MRNLKEMLTERFGKLNELQEEALLFNGRNVILHSSTGSGKTEAALLVLPTGSSVDWFLPTIASCNFMYRRLVRDFPNISVKVNTSQYRDERIVDDPELTINIHTPDFAMITFVEGIIHRNEYKMTTKKCVVIDEIDLYPKKLLSTLIKYVDTFRRGNGLDQVIVSSATVAKNIIEAFPEFSILTMEQPNVLRCKVYNNEIKITGYEDERCSRDYSKVWESEFNNEELFHEYFGEDVDCYSFDRGESYTKFDPTGIIKEEIDKRINSGKRVAFLCNSITNMCYVYDCVEEMGYDVDDMLYYHSQLNDKLKNEIDERIFNNDYKILVSNDLVSMSVNIDIDLLFMEISDQMNINIQRIGRLNRIGSNIKDINLIVYYPGYGCIFPGFMDVEDVIMNHKELFSQEEIWSDQIRDIISKLEVEIEAFDDVIEYATETAREQEIFNLRDIHYEFKVYDKYGKLSTVKADNIPFITDEKCCSKPNGKRDVIEIDITERQYSWLGKIFNCRNCNLYFAIKDIDALKTGSSLMELVNRDNLYTKEGRRFETPTHHETLMDIVKEYPFVDKYGRLTVDGNVRIDDTDTRYALRDFIYEMRDAAGWNSQHDVRMEILDYYKNKLTMKDLPLLAEVSYLKSTRDGEVYRAVDEDRIAINPELAEYFIYMNTAEINISGKRMSKEISFTSFIAILERMFFFGKGTSERKLTTEIRYNESIFHLKSLDGFSTDIKIKHTMGGSILYIDIHKITPYSDYHKRYNLRNSYDSSIIEEIINDRILELNIPSATVRRLLDHYTTIYWYKTEESFESRINEFLRENFKMFNHMVRVNDYDGIYYDYNHLFNDHLLAQAIMSSSTIENLKEGKSKFKNFEVFNDNELVFTFSYDLAYNPYRSFFHVHLFCNDLDLKTIKITEKNGDVVIYPETSIKDVEKIREILDYINYYEKTDDDDTDNDVRKLNKKEFTNKLEDLKSMVYTYFRAVEYGGKFSSRKSIKDAVEFLITGEAKIGRVGGLLIINGKNDTYISNEDIEDKVIYTFKKFGLTPSMVEHLYRNGDDNPLMYHVPLLGGKTESLPFYNYENDKFSLNYEIVKYLPSVIDDDLDIKQYTLSEYFLYTYLHKDHIEVKYISPLHTRIKYKEQYGENKTKYFKILDIYHNGRGEILKIRERTYYSYQKIGIDYPEHVDEFDSLEEFREITKRSKYSSTVNIIEKRFDEIGTDKLNTTLLDVIAPVLNIEENFYSLILKSIVKERSENREMCINYTSTENDTTTIKYDIVDEWSRDRLVDDCELQIKRQDGQFLFKIKHGTLSCDIISNDFLPLLNVLDQSISSDQYDKEYLSEAISSYINNNK